MSDSRPKNRAREVRVPYSASNLSSKGVRARTLRKACRNPACTRANVFVRYTGHDRVSCYFFSKVKEGGSELTATNIDLVGYKRAKALYIPYGPQNNAEEP